MSTHTERAARMGYAGPAAAKPRAVAEPQKSLYGNSGLDVPIASYYDRREATLRRDREGMETARAERKQVEAFARSRGITSEHLHAALAVMGEYDNFPKKPETIVARRAATVEALRLEKGGIEQAIAHHNRYVSVAAALAKEVPSLAARANATGAGEDPRIINALAHYGEAPTGETK